MAKCSRIRIKKRKLCLGDFNKRVTLQSRGIAAPLFGSSNFDETFANTNTVWAAVDTVAGQTFFDGVADREVSHIIYIRFDSTVTAETWILYNNRRIDILNVENFGERNEYLKLICNERGPDTQEANKL